MPELPEVETIRRELAPELEGRTITAVRVHQEDILMNLPSRREFARLVAARRIETVERRAKFLLFLLSPARVSRPGGEGGPAVLQVQLRMTGRFHLGCRPPDPARFSHIAAELELNDGRTLHYDDVRRLGGFQFLSRREWEEAEKALGPEPLGPWFTREALGKILARRRAAVKNLLMDPRRLAGIGNIYACEALHRAAIDPRREGGTLGIEEVARLRRSIRDTLREALSSAGTTFRDYRSVNGRPGSFQKRLRVYGREGRACPGCGTRVRKIRQAGRGTYFCPDCQT